jgi:glycosyltransferase involved in cell wall biosynthesis
MRIGFFTSIEGWGGSEIYLQTLMMSLREEGHEPVLIGIKGSRLFKELLARQIECHSWREGRNISGSSEAVVKDAAQSAAATVIPKAVLDIKTNCRKLKDKVLGFTPGWLKLLLGNIGEVRHLRKTFSGLGLDVLQVTVHGYEMAGLAARLCGVPVVAVYQISPVEEHSFVRRLLIRWSAWTYDRVCFVSHYSAVEWRKITGLAAGRCEVVPNGADLQLYAGCSREVARNAKGVFRLVSVGRLHPMKGYRYLIEAMADLKDTAVSLDILGEGAEEAELRELAHSLGVESIVNFRGYIDNPVDYLKQADCFVLASVSHEGSPFVLAEAMAAGLPLITSDFGPLPEINIQNETGLVVPTGDSRALSKAIRRMQSDPDLTQGMGMAALKRATQYDQRQMVTKMMEIYSKRYRQ